MTCYLVTGGVGSLGRRLVAELLKPKYNANPIRVLDHNENGLAQMQIRLGDSRIRYFLGDIRDKERVIRAMENVDVAILCAALKHVQICEYNPFESIQSNVIGTQNCIDAALKANIRKLLFVSSDKAVHAVNTYGRCKALSESLTLDANNYKGDRRTKFSVCRPPNYINSDGSVFEIWNYQKAKGLPLTVTHTAMERFFMPFSDIIAFTLKCVRLMEGGEIFVPIGAEKKRIIDLAREISSNIKIVGKRKGERLVEHLFTEEEMLRAEKRNGIWVIHK